jgi:photosystem II stability/assembly factor-like uncharacterized protein
LLETFDDDSWELRKITDHDLWAVSCIDNEVGWSVGASGFIGHTRDGGWSWPAQESGVTSALRAVSFARSATNAEVGLAVGDAATLLTTQDGGQHWSTIAADGATTLRGGAATLRGTAITQGATLLVAVGDAGVVLRSTDLGLHFTSSRIAGAADLFDIALDATGELALAVDSAGGVWASHDGAQGFALEHRADAALESVSLGAKAQLGSAAGAGAPLLRDAAGTWRMLGGDGTQLHATLVGPHEDRAYFAGEGGTLLETASGDALLRVAADTHAALRGIEDLEAR